MVGSRVRTGVLVAAVVAWASLGSSAAVAQGAEGDAERGRVLAYTCLGCHAIENYKNAYPTYSVPKLEGQHPQYIVTALQAYKSGERSHMTMHSQAASLSEQDMADIAVFFADKPLESAEVPQSAQVPESAQLCVSCHGQNGVGITPMYPTLAGQHEDYLARALLDYKRGARKNAIMAGFATQLTNEQIEELARFYARQQPGLKTVDRSRAIDRTKATASR